MSKAPSDSEFINLPTGTTTAGLLVRTCVVPPDVLASHGIEARGTTTVEIDAGTELYQLVTAYLVDQSTSARSFKLDIGKGKRNGCCGSDSDDSGDDGEPCRIACKDLGLGRFDFSFEGKEMIALHFTLGEVVGTNCGPSLMKSLVLMSSSCDNAASAVAASKSAAQPAAVDLITRFCDTLIAKADTTSASTFSIYRWHVQYSYWRKAEVVKARPIESVVLDSSIKDKIVDDMAEFISPSTREWYQYHGVPYKRSFLLHGTPGAGKTSLIQALAGHFRRDVCFLQPAHPDMTDDCLKAAIEGAPPRAMIVLEDVDALFHGRARASFAGSASPLTFSGLLNALDGVGSAGGRLFVLTTNHREKLDPALIRCGRVDQHVRFDCVVDEQLAGLFRQFYPRCDAAQPDAFVAAVRKVLAGRDVAAAAVQALFIKCRRASAAEAIERVSFIVEELESRDPKADEKWRKSRHTAAAEEEE